MATKTDKKLNHIDGLKLAPRPPVVVIVGHVDHGKTTLLDYIRKANVAGREAGGITQAVGAYEIEHVLPGAEKTMRKITFIDTPGHEAFSAMRSRGAQIADLAVLVIAADEGLKPQTHEAIKILQDSKTPFVVALNKIDKVAGGNIEKVKGDLAAAGVLLEGYGGQVSYHGVSAKTGEGVDDLLDLILLTADVEGLTYDPAVPASGYVLEVKRDPRRGIEASLIIKNGTLMRGGTVATATASGKVKILENFAGKTIEQAEPSAPVLVIGFDELPNVGEEFFVRESDADAGSLAAAPRVAQRQVSGIAPKNSNTLNLILKSSDAGSLEALSVVLRGIEKTGTHSTSKEIHIVDEGVGDITDGDVRHASATGSAIIGFKNRIEKGARILAEAQSIPVITSNIVYDLSKGVEEFLTGARGPAALGELEVLAIFSQEKPEKQLIGGKVLSGLVREKASFDIIRAGNEGPIATGRIANLREKKSEITQAEKGKEIGLLVESRVLIQVGDTLMAKK